MIYVSTHSAQVVVVTGTTSTEFTFTNNQTQETYSVDLQAIGITPNGERKQTAFLVQWVNSERERSAEVIDNVLVMKLPSGEYNFELGCVNGLMMLMEDADRTTYENDSNNMVYNG